MLRAYSRPPQAGNSANIPGRPLFERLWRKDAARSDASHAGLGHSLAQSCARALGFVLIANLDSRGVLSVSLTSEISYS